MIRQHTGNWAPACPRYMSKPAGVLLLFESKLEWFLADRSVALREITPSKATLSRVISHTPFLPSHYTLIYLNTKANELRYARAKLGGKAVPSASEALFRKPMGMVSEQWRKGTLHRVHFQYFFLLHVLHMELSWDSRTKPLFELFMSYASSSFLKSNVTQLESS